MGRGEKSSKRKNRRTYQNLLSDSNLSESPPKILFSIPAGKTCYSEHPFPDTLTRAALAYNFQAAEGTGGERQDLKTSQVMYAGLHLAASPLNAPFREAVQRTPGGGEGGESH